MLLLVVRIKLLGLIVEIGINFLGVLILVFCFIWVYGLIGFI